MMRCDCDARFARWCEGDHGVPETLPFSEGVMDQAGLSAAERATRVLPASLQQLGGQRVGG